MNNSEKGGLGLASIGDLAALLDSGNESSGVPLEIPLDSIDEDPDQPRTYFDAAKLEEMAATIRLRGIKTPISVRPHPTISKRYIINHGARRYRASILAGKKTIPGYIDSNYINDDQVIENIQRESLTPREIANYLDKLISSGIKKGGIATQLGKSPAFVTQHLALLDLPDPIAEVFNNGRCKDVTVINELVTAYKKNPMEITDFLGDEDIEITRGTVKVLRNSLENARCPNTDGLENGATDEEQEKIKPKSGNKSKEADPSKMIKGIVLVDYDGRPGRLLLTKRPTADDTGWIRFEVDGTEEEVGLENLTILSVIEGNND